MVIQIKDNVMMTILNYEYLMVDKQAEDRLNYYIYQQNKKLLMKTTLLVLMMIIYLAYSCPYTCNQCDQSNVCLNSSCISGYKWNNDTQTCQSQLSGLMIAVIAITPAIFGVGWIYAWVRYKRYIKNKKIKRRNKNKQNLSTLQVELAAYYNNNIYETTLKSNKISWKVSEKFAQMCTICLQKGNTVTSCGHVFHAKCLDDWAKRSNSCPLCHKQLKQSITVMCENCGLFGFKVSLQQAVQLARDNFQKKRVLCRNCEE